MNAIRTAAALAPKQDVSWTFGGRYRAGKPTDATDPDSRSGLTFLFPNQLPSS